MNNVQSATKHLSSLKLMVFNEVNVVIMMLSGFLGDVIISFECASRVHIHGSIFSIKRFCLQVFKVDMDLDVIDKL